MLQAPPDETSVHKSRVLRPAVAVIAVGLIASPLPASSGHPWSTIRHTGHQRTVAPITTEHPIHYPRSVRSQPGRAPADTLLRKLFELHTAMAYEEAAVVADRLVQTAPARAEAHYNRACVMGRLRRADEAISSLERAVEHGWSDLVHLSIDPDLDSVRGSTRYQALVEQLRRSGDRRVTDRALPVTARVNELQRRIPALLARDGVSAATLAVVEDGLVVWSATFGSSQADAGWTRGTIEAGPAVRLLALTALLRHGEPRTTSTVASRDAEIRLTANTPATHLDGRIIKAIEDATGERFVDCCRRHVLEPLAMLDTRIAGPTGAWAMTTTADDLGRLLESLCDAARPRPAAQWLDLAARLDLDAWVDGRTGTVFLELSQPSVGGFLLLRWSPRLGRGVMVMTSGDDDGRTAGRIAALGVTAH